MPPSRKKKFPAWLSSCPKKNNFALRTYRSGKRIWTVEILKENKFLHVASWLGRYIQPVKMKNEGIDVEEFEKMVSDAARVRRMESDIAFYVTRNILGTRMTDWFLKVDCVVQIFFVGQREWINQKIQECYTRSLLLDCFAVDPEYDEHEVLCESDKRTKDSPLPTHFLPVEE